MIDAEVEGGVYEIELFNSADRFDNQKLVDLIRTSEKTKELLRIRRKLASGFSTLSRIPGKLLKKRFKKILKSEGDHSRRGLISSTFFSYFFNSTLDILKQLNCSDFTSVKTTRIRRAAILTSALTGWPLQTIISLAHLYLLEISSISGSDLSILDDIQGVEEQTADFCKLVANNPIKAWRPRFSFAPYDLLEMLQANDKAEDNRWSFLKDAVSNQDEELFASKLHEVILNESGDDAFLSQAAANLILSGVDLSSEEHILLGIKKLNSVPEKTRESLSALHRLTTMALGYAAVGAIDQSLQCLQRVPHEDKLNISFLGFAGSLLTAATSIEDAAQLFFLAFKLRTTPTVWPLRVLSFLDPNLERTILTSIGSPKLPEFIDCSKGTSFSKILLSEHPNWGNNEALLAPITGKPKPSAGESRKVIRCGTTKEPFVPEKVTGELKIDYDQKLVILIDYYNEICDSGRRLEEALARRDYKEVKIQANTIEKIWRKCVSKIDELIADASSFNIHVNVDPARHILEGSKDPKDILEAAEQLNNIYGSEFSRKKKAFQEEVLQYKERLLRAGLKDRVPDVISNAGEFEKLVQETGSLLTRAEKMEGLEKGIVAPSEFASLFSEDVRQDILLTIFDKFDRLSLPTPKSFSDIIGGVTWPESRAPRAFSFFLRSIRARFPSGLINPKYLTGSILPILYQFSEIMGELPFSLFAKEDILIRSLTHLLREPGSTNLHQLLVSLVPVDKDTIFESFGQTPESADSILLMKDFVFSLMDCDDRISPELRTALLAELFYRCDSRQNESHVDSIIDVLVRLRDELIRDGRALEATFLVASSWRLYKDERVFRDFDKHFYNVLTSLAKDMDTDKGVIESLLVNPGWLLHEEGGIIYYLFLCYLCNLKTLGHSCTYQHFSAIEDAKNRFPILMRELLAPEDFDPNGTDSPLAKAEIVWGLRARDELEHDLLKLSSYKSWPPGALYQKVFNRQLIEYRDEIYTCDPADLYNMEEKLVSIVPASLIQAANGELDFQVNYRARQHMERYIKEQVERLSILLSVKLKAQVDDLTAFLESTKKGRKDLLLEEYKSIISPPFLLSHVYASILEVIG